VLEQLRDAPAARSGPVSVAFLAGCGQARLAFAVGKRVGKAVVRNRVRRRLREAARQQLDLAPGTYLVRARPEAARLDFAALAHHLARAATAAMAAPHRASERGAAP
jgi:ribonuclease P protein component